VGYDKLDKEIKQHSDFKRLHLDLFWNDFNITYFFISGKTNDNKLVRF
jgi:hypothetical protein